METIILATKNCSHYPILGMQLDKLGVAWDLKYVEDYPELAGKYEIQSSPNLVVNGKVIFRAGAGKSLPAPADLKAVFQK